MNLPSTLVTGSGTWNPLLWLAAFAVALIAGLVIRAFGRKDYRNTTKQTESFISGNDMPENGAEHIPASSMYWGFLESMKAYYQRVVPAHTGNVTDYLAWFVGVLALTLVIGILA